MNTIPIILASLLFLAGCSTVVSNHPVGLENYPVNPTEWEGTWLGDEVTITIKVVDATKGIVNLSWIEESANKLRAKSMVIQIMKGRKWLYANVLEAEGEKSDEIYYWGKIVKDTRQIIIWHPSVENFVKAAETHKIQAVIHRSTMETNGKIGFKEPMVDSVQLIDSPEKIISLIEDGAVNYFEWEKPTVLIKLLK